MGSYWDLLLFTLALLLACAGVVAIIAGAFGLGMLVYGKNKYLGWVYYILLVVGGLMFGVWLMWNGLQGVRIIG